jgi:hypothetical protein
MGHCPTSEEKESRRAEASLAKALAPEEIRRGDFVAPLYVISEWPSWMWCCDDSLRPREELVRMCTVPCEEMQPLKVREVCLPFVLAKGPDGAHRTLDVRKCRLGRLDEKFARAAWRGYRKAVKRAEGFAKTR